VEGGDVLRHPVILQHVKQGRLTSIVQSLTKKDEHHYFIVAAEVFLYRFSVVELSTVSQFHIHQLQIRTQDLNQNLYKSPDFL
jgi:hypothetical protein